MFQLFCRRLTELQWILNIMPLGHRFLVKHMLMIDISSESHCTFELPYIMLFLVHFQDRPWKLQSGSDDDAGAWVMRLRRSRPCRQAKIWPRVGDTGWFQVRTSILNLILTVTQVLNCQYEHGQLRMTSLRAGWHISLIQTWPGQNGTFVLMSTGGLNQLADFRTISDSWFESIHDSWVINLWMERTT